MNLEWEGGSRNTEKVGQILRKTANFEIHNFFRFFLCDFLVSFTLKKDEDPLDPTMHFLFSIIYSFVCLTVVCSFEVSLI